MLKRKTVIIVLISGMCVLFGQLTTAATQRKPIPAGSPMTESIHYQFAIYYLPKPKQDPLKILRQRLGSKGSVFKWTDRFPDKPQELLIQASLEKDVQQQYAPPDMESLQYFGRGLSRDQATTLQQSQQVLIMNFAYPSKHVWKGTRAASELIEQLARQTGGLVWDEMTREVFTPQAWQEIRLTKWADGMPAIASHTTIHAYKDDEFVRAITLGMAKFGLPDVVIDNFPWSSNSSVGNVINLFTQAMAEGARFSKAGEFDLNIKAIKHPEVRTAQLESLRSKASAVALLALWQGQWEEGDPDNRLIQIGFERYPGRDAHAKRDAMLASLFGAEDSVTYIKHDDALLAASKKAKAKLPALRAAFNAGLQPGEFIQVKAPFAVPGGGNEWMWVEVSKWKGNKIEGLLKNEPHNIPTLHGGQMVEVKQQEVFDYIRQYPDGREEGNETGKIIQKMQSRNRD